MGPSRFAHWAREGSRETSRSARVGPRSLPPRATAHRPPLDTPCAIELAHYTKKRRDTRWRARDTARSRKRASRVSRRCRNRAPGALLPRRPRRRTHRGRPARPGYRRRGSRRPAATRPTRSPRAATPPSATPRDRVQRSACGAGPRCSNEDGHCSSARWPRRSARRVRRRRHRADQLGPRPRGDARSHTNRARQDAALAAAVKKLGLGRRLPRSRRPPRRFAEAIGMGDESKAARAGSRYATRSRVARRVRPGARRARLGDHRRDPGDRTRAEALQALARPVDRQRGGARRRPRACGACHKPLLDPAALARAPTRVRASREPSAFTAHPTSHPAGCAPRLARRPTSPTAPALRHRHTPGLATQPARTPAAPRPTPHSHPWRLKAFAFLLNAPGPTPTPSELCLPVPPPTQLPTPQNRPTGNHAVFPVRPPRTPGAQGTDTPVRRDTFYGQLLSFVRSAPGFLRLRQRGERRGAVSSLAPNACPRSGCADGFQWPTRTETTDRRDPDPGHRLPPPLPACVDGATWVDTDGDGQHNRGYPSCPAVLLHRAPDTRPIDTNGQRRLHRHLRPDGVPAVLRAAPDGQHLEEYRPRRLRRAALAGGARHRDRLPPAARCRSIPTAMAAWTRAARSSCPELYLDCRELHPANTRRRRHRRLQARHGLPIALDCAWTTLKDTDHDGCLDACAARLPAGVLRLRAARCRWTRTATAAWTGAARSRARRTAPRGPARDRPRRRRVHRVARAGLVPRVLPVPVRRRRALRGPRRRRLPGDLRGGCARRRRRSPRATPRRTRRRRARRRASRSWPPAHRDRVRAWYAPVDTDGDTCLDACAPHGCPPVYFDCPRGA